MRRMLTATVVAMLAGSVGLRGDDTAARWWSHVEALANDGMEGRNTGSPAHKRAAEYVAAQFKKSGLEPAGIGGYIQPVAFKTRKIDESKSSLALVRNGKSEAARAGRRREHQRPRRSRRVGRRAAGLRRLRPEHPRAQHQRLRRRESQRRDRRLRLVDAEVAAGPAAGALRLGGRALEDVQGRRRGRHRQHRQPEEHGHPLGALDAGAAAAGDVARRRLARRCAGTAAGGDDEPGARGEAVRRLRPHLRRDAGARRRRQAGAALRAAGPAQGDGRRRARAGRVAERRRHPARVRPEAARRVRRLVRAPRSPRASAARSTATRSTTARWTTPRASPRSSTSRRRCTSRRRSRRGRSCSSR